MDNYECGPGLQMLKVHSVTFDLSVKKFNSICLIEKRDFGHFSSLHR